MRVTQSETTISLWQVEDHAAAIGVVREVFDEYGFTWEEEGYHADLYDVQRQYLDDGDLFFVARWGGEIVGTAALEFFPAFLIDTFQGEVRIAGTDCSLNRLYVRKKARGAGVGSALLSRIVGEATAKGCRAMEIWSDKRFEDAHRLYKRFGAEVISERVCDDPDESPEWGMRLKLAERGR
jgi:putative acetyltransferase